MAAAVLRLWILYGSGGFWSHLAEAVICGIAVCALFYLLFLCRMMGAGDIKLMAFCVSVLGMKDGFPVIFLGLLLAAIHGAEKLIAKGLLWEKMARLSTFMLQWGYDGKLREYPGREDGDSRIRMGGYLLSGCCLWLLLRWPGMQQ